MTDEQIIKWALKNQRLHETLLREGSVLYDMADLMAYVEPQWNKCGAESDYRRGFFHAMAYASMLIDSLYRDGFVRASEIANIIGRFAHEDVLRWRSAAFNNVVAGKNLHGHPHLKMESWFEIRKRILQRDNSLCRNCFQPSTPDNPIHVDHIEPVARGGLPDDNNLQALCRSCNLNKGAS